MLHHDQGSIHIVSLLVHDSVLVGEVERCDTRESHAPLLLQHDLVAFEEVGKKPYRIDLCNSEDVNRCDDNGHQGVA